MALPAAAPTISSALASSLITGGGALLGGAGAGLGNYLGSKAEAAAQKEALKGPIRGGSARAGNQDTLGLELDQSTMEKLGQNAVGRSPVYGDPIDLNSLFKPNSFGQGYSVGQPQKRF